MTKKAKTVDGTITVSKSDNTVVLAGKDYTEDNYRRLVSIHGAGNVTADPAFADPEPPPEPLVLDPDPGSDATGSGSANGAASGAGDAVS